jgi:hypothetical protein
VGWLWLIVCGCYGYGYLGCPSHFIIVGGLYVFLSHLVLDSLGFPGVGLGFSMFLLSGLGFLGISAIGLDLSVICS